MAFARLPEHLSPALAFCLYRSRLRPFPGWEPPRQGASGAIRLLASICFLSPLQRSFKGFVALHLSSWRLASCLSQDAPLRGLPVSPCWAWMSPTLTQRLQNPKPLIPFMFLYFSLSGLTFVPISPWVPEEQGWAASSAMLRSPCGGLNTLVLPQVKENSAFNGSPG